MQVARAAKQSFQPCETDEVFDGKAHPYDIHRNLLVLIVLDVTKLTNLKTII